MGTISYLDIRKAVLVTKFLDWIEEKTNSEHRSGDGGIKPSGIR